jgi:hypothetical protein
MTGRLEKLNPRVPARPDRRETAMRAVQNTTDRLVLRGGSPLFRPFFLGGLGLLVVGALLLVGGPRLRSTLPGPPSGADPPVEVPGLGVFLATFGFFVAIVPLIGKLPYRKEIVVDRAAGRFVRRDRTLLRLREETYPLGEVRGVDVEEARHVDGDPYFMLLLRLGSGDSVTLDRFTDRSDAGTAVRLLRGHLSPDAPRETDPTA